MSTKPVNRYGNLPKAPAHLRRNAAFYGTDGMKRSYEKLEVKDKPQLETIKEVAEEKLTLKEALRSDPPDMKRKKDE